jgi:hypothetical protein
MRTASGERGQTMPLVLAAVALVVAAMAGAVVLAATRIAQGGARVAADLAALSAGRAMLDALPGAMVDPWDLRRRLLAVSDDAARRSATASGAHVVSVQLVPGGAVPTEVQVRVRRPAPMGLTVTATARAGFRGTPQLKARPVRASVGGAKGPHPRVRLKRVLLPEVRGDGIRLSLDDEGIPTDEVGGGMHRLAVGEQLHAVTDEPRLKRLHEAVAPPLLRLLRGFSDELIVCVQLQRHLLRGRLPGALAITPTQAIALAGIELTIQRKFRSWLRTGQPRVQGLFSNLHLRG